MLRHRLILATSAIALVVPAAQAQTDLPSMREEILQQFNTSMEKLVALAEAMPANRFNWSPAPGVMTVEKVYAHIARYNYGYPIENLKMAPPVGLNLDAIEGTTGKAAVVALLKASGEYVRENVEGMKDADTGEEALLYGRRVAKGAVLIQLVAHMNEHLGQSIAYARMNGIVPPWSR